MATSKESSIVFADLMASYKAEYENAMTKDQVDEIEKDLEKGLSITFNFRSNELDRIATVHDMNDLPAVTNLRTRYGKDAERLGSRIG